MFVEGLKKVVLAPVFLVLLIVEAFGRAVSRTASFVSGPVQLFTALCDLYCIFQGRWQDVFLLSLILVMLFLGQSTVITVTELIRYFRQSLFRI